MPKTVGKKQEGRQQRSKQRKKKSPTCKTCGTTIRVPAGWSPGAATRRHYWSRHPEVMRGEDS